MIEKWDTGDKVQYKDANDTDPIYMIGTCRLLGANTYIVTILDDDWRLVYTKNKGYEHPATLFKSAARLVKINSLLAQEPDSNS